MSRTTDLIAALVESGAAPGAQLAVVGPAGTIEEGAWGACDEHGLAPVTVETRFPLASLTKPIVATAVLVAAEEGSVELDAPIADHVAGVAPQVTLRNALAHYSGLPESMSVSGLGAGDEPTWAELCAAYAQVAPELPAGTRRVYSNVGYALAGLAVEHATGLPFPQYLREAVLEPLGMRSTTLGLEGGSGADVAFVREPGLWRRGVALFNSGSYRALPFPQSGLIASARDYGAFLRFVLRRGPADDGRALLAPETLDELVQNQGGSLEGGVLSFMTWPRADWACGFELRDAKPAHWTGPALSPSAATHFGASGTLCFADFEAGVGAALLINRGTYSGWMLQPGGWPEICAAIVS